MKQLEHLLDSIVRALVVHPERVVVTRLDLEMVTEFEIRVDPLDLGRVIGQKGRTAKAIRMLVRACGQKEVRIVNLEIRSYG